MVTVNRHVINVMIIIIIISSGRFIMIISCNSKLEGLLGCHRQADVLSL
jgi:hypothetical protein